MMVNQRFFTKVGAVAALAVGVPLWNYLENHTSYTDTDHTLVLRKMDGYYAHSQIEISYHRNDLILHVTDYFGDGSRRYSDNDRDGKIDAVVIDFPIIQTTGIQGSFNLDQHAQTHPEVFEEENKLYQQHLQEFKEDFPEQWRRMGLDNLVK